MTSPPETRSDTALRLRHEVKTALSAIIGYTELVLSFAKVSAPVMALAKRMSGAARAVHQLAEQGTERAVEESWSEPELLEHLRSLLLSPLRRIAADCRRLDGVEGHEADHEDRERPRVDLHRVNSSGV